MTSSNVQLVIATLQKETFMHVLSSIRESTKNLGTEVGCKKHIKFQNPFSVLFMQSKYLLCFSIEHRYLSCFTITRAGRMYPSCSRYIVAYYPVCLGYQSILWMWSTWRFSSRSTKISYSNSVSELDITFWAFHRKNRWQNWLQLEPLAKLNMKNICVMNIAAGKKNEKSSFYGSDGFQIYSMQSPYLLVTSIFLTACRLR